MNEFEKWLEKEIKPKQKPNPSGFPFCLTHNNARKEAWKAALEWALSLNSVRIDDDVCEDIEEELLD